MPQPSFEQFKARILADESLQSRLRDIRDRLEFFDETTALAAELDYHITRDDVEKALQAGSQAWIERWI